MRATSAADRRVGAASLVVLAVLVATVALGPWCALAFEGLFDWHAGATVGSDAQAAPTPPIKVFLLSAAVALSASIVGTLLAWPASVALRRHARSRRMLALGAATMLPIALPPWLLFAALWLSAGPGTAIGDLAERADLVWFLRIAILAIVLLAWSMSLAFASLVIAAPIPSPSQQRLGAMDAWSFRARLRAAWWRDRHALMLGAAVSSVFLLGETTAFDLAQVRTFGFELRTLDSLGASEHDLVLAALPAILLLAAILGGALAFGRRAMLHGHGGRASPGVTRGALVAVALTAAVPTVVSALFLAQLLKVQRPGDFLGLHGGAAATTLAVALAVGLVVALAAIAVRLLLASGGWARRLVLPLACTLAIAALLPATLTARGATAAFNNGALAFIYDTPLVLVVTLVSRTAVAAVLVAVLLDLRERRSVRGLRALDAAHWLGFWRSLRSELMATGAAGLAIGFAWSLGELTASSRVVPPGTAWMATDMLNAIHYQRPETVVLGASLLLLAAVPAVAVLAWLLRQVVLRVPAVHLLAVASGMLLVACGRGEPVERGGTDAPLDPETAAMLARGSAPTVASLLPDARILGSPGRGKGQFYGPRVIAAEPSRGSYFVIDKDARVQRITPEGRVLAEWTMPKFDRGKPVGASVSPEGLLVVADTHEHRVIAFDADGRLVWQFGSYGMGPSEFIHPTDIAFAPDGRIFVAEYGSNDRIQVFDREHRFLYAFGSFGSGPGQFLRPQAIEYDAARDELYVLDVGNHRVQVLTGDGEFRRAFGKLGRAEGELAYPFGLVLEIDGAPVDLVDPAKAPQPDERRRTVVVAEHSNHRIQRFDAATGAVLATCGGLGTAGGRVKYPWALAPAGVSEGGEARFVVVDHGNSRLQFFTLGSGPSGARAR
ncbi:MAG: NHL repeat-containing protein [Planctomycetota bacterium]